MVTNWSCSMPKMCLPFDIEIGKTVKLLSKWKSWSLICKWKKIKQCEKPTGVSEECWVLLLSPVLL